MRSIFPLLLPRVILSNEENFSSSKSFFMFTFMLDFISFDYPSRQIEFLAGNLLNYCWLMNHWSAIAENSVDTICRGLIKHHALLMPLIFPSAT
jgi:hypothetical protein